MYQETQKNGKNFLKEDEKQIINIYLNLLTLHFYVFNFIIISVLVFFFLWVKFKTFFPDHCLQQFFCRLKVVPWPIEWFITLRFCLFIVKSFEIWVLQTLLNSISFLRIEYQHFTKQIECNWVSFWIQTGPALFVSLWELSNIFTG